MEDLSFRSWDELGCPRFFREQERKIEFTNIHSVGRHRFITSVIRNSLVTDLKGAVSGKLQRWKYWLGIWYFDPELSNNRPTVYFSCGWMSDVANYRCKRANTCLLYSFNHNRLWKDKKNYSRRGHRIGTTITFYSYFRNSLPNPPSYSYSGFIHIPDEDKHRTSKLLSSPGTEHNDLVMSSILESRQGSFLESPGNFNNGPQGFFLVWKFKE